MQDKLEIMAEIKGLKELFLEKFARNDQDHQAITIQLAKMEMDAEKINNDHERRISALENWRWYLIGIGTIAVFIIDILLKKLK